MKNRTVVNVLLVEDDPAQVTLALVAITKANQANGKEMVVQVARDGAEAWDELQVKKFDLILLDLRLPRLDGLEVLRLIKQDDRLKVIPVVILTTSDLEADMTEAYQRYVNAYVVKPLNQFKMVELTKKFKNFWTAEQVRLAAL